MNAAVSQAASTPTSNGETSSARIATSGRASSVTWVPTWLMTSATKSWRKSCSRSRPRRALTDLSMDN